MLSRFTKLRLVDLLYTFADGEIKTEVVRQVLAEKPAFEPYAAFKRIALAPNPHLTSSDLQEFLLDNNINVTSKEAYHLIRLYDTNQDGRLSFSEFLNAVLPKDDPSLRQRVTMRPTYDVEEGERLAYDVEYGIARIFEEELKNFKRAENLKQELSYCYDFSILNAFKTLDIDAKNYLTPEDLADFMEDNGKSIDDKELKALFRKVDIDLDNRVNYSEFLETMFSSQVDLSTSKAEFSSPSKRTYTSPKKRSFDEEDDRRAYTSPRPKRFDNENRDEEYNDYLRESKMKHSPQKNEEKAEEELYRTPTKSNYKYSADDLEDEEDVSPIRQSPLRGNEEEELVRSLKEMINNSRLIENTKNDLALRPDFNLFDAFRFFDFLGKGAYISSRQFHEGCEDLNIFPTKDEVFLFFRRTDADYDGYIRFTDFCKVLTPKSEEFARILDKRTPRYPDLEEGDELFSEETRRLFAKVIGIAIENEVKAESIRQRLARRPLFNLYDAFRAVDRLDQNYIVLDDFKDILDEYGVFASAKDLNNLVERFKGVEGKNGKISYSDFIRELTPKSARIY